jgi:hypothetical protein
VEARGWQRLYNSTGARLAVHWASDVEVWWRDSAISQPQDRDRTEGDSGTASAGCEMIEKPQRTCK